jgi:hypothetical protein
MAYTGDQTPGYHGNQSTGIASVEKRLQKGQPFIGLALDLYHAELARRGYTEAQLARMGTQGAIIEKTCKLHTIAELLWSAMMWSAERGDVDDFKAIEARYGNRLTQSLTYDYKLLELLREEAGIIDYDAAMDAAASHTEQQEGGDDDNGG